jgi:hypothetical protein
MVWPVFGITTSAALMIVRFISSAGSRHGQSSSPVITRVGAVIVFIRSTRSNSLFLDQLVDVIAALAVAFSALDTEHVELAFDVAEDEIRSWHLTMLSRFLLRETPALCC